MMQTRNKPSATGRRTSIKNKKSILFAGLLLTLLGCIFLLQSFSQTITAQLIGSFLVIIIGAISLIFIVMLGKSSWLFFVSIMTFLSGIYFLVLFSGIFAPQFVFSTTWPVLSLIVAMSLLPTGWRHYKKLKFVYIIPSISFIGLSGLMLLFSTGLVKITIKQIILRGLPVFMILLGLLMILLSFKKTPTEKKTSD
ncbi:MAG: hypothetical protein Ta2F_04970 [Termitinemataceae bacterium]|nr:MAG: hypothetical protein Ta2F_04970 [Termitinemataceae bacterium]